MSITSIFILIPVLKGEVELLDPGKGYGWELFEMRAYIRGTWKILRLPPPLGSGVWELYDLSKDPMEMNDLSSQFPQVKEELIEAWKGYSVENGIHDHKGHYDSLYRISFTKPKTH